MKLTHKTTQFVIAERLGSYLTIKDPLLLAQLKMNGIEIPPFMRPIFQNKKVIYLDDPLFTQAFEDVYLKLYIDQKGYEWKI
ncbi:MAG: hypothetical protein NT065_04400 [Chlamydiae bacterium]|nr:hypothetical protein [Chlamydiota bacterium]